ncbi:hypothetical protein KHA94_09355 [Bacillus sp. FJAT-49705]|uniref:Uncharacterized protein n=1 Tax=Cytobacillus citreus TaxID=2833586 RepID=A0ABS5NSL1_9BACI|nr:hypothetical protein [Cytobacillus citreus]MBS4190403.1 hypothetical protein [Cytobacillus citreus]
MKKKKNRLFIWMIVFICIVVIASFFIPWTTKPSGETRVILEHTYKTYIAPLCFETSNATNFLEESTLQSAQDLDYKPHSSCTEDALKAENDSLFESILKEIGIIGKKRNNW